MKRLVMFGLAGIAAACSSDSATDEIMVTAAPVATETPATPAAPATPSEMAPPAAPAPVVDPVTPVDPAPPAEMPAVPPAEMPAVPPAEMPVDPAPPAAMPATPVEMPVAPAPPAEMPATPVEMPVDPAPPAEMPTEPPTVTPPAEKSMMTFFVTSRGHENGGNFGGLAGADAMCQELATAVGGGDHTWHAYLSTEGADGVDARDRIGTGPWVNHAGETVAENLEALHTNGVSNDEPQHIIDENGEEVPPGGGGNGMHDIVTGTSAVGTVLEGYTCNNWTEEGNQQDGPVASVGHSDLARAERPGWNDARDVGSPTPHFTASCMARPAGSDHRGTIGSGGGEGRIYCFAID